jgi:hypothetical protein
MQRDDLKSQLFTLDLMLALIPLTIAMGITASAISGLSSQVVSFSHLFGNEQSAMDALDLLIKTPGSPPDWNSSSIPAFTSIGLTQYGYIDLYDDTRSLTNVLDRGKLKALHLNRSNSNLAQAMRDLTGGRNLIIISNSTDSDLDFTVMWYNNNGTWTATNDTATINAALAGARNVYTATRLVRSVTEIIGDAEYIWGYNGSDIIQSTPSIADIDCDGENEIVVGTNDDVNATGSGGVTAFEGNGTQMWYYPSGKAYTSSPALVDLDGDCGLEVLIGQAECPGENNCGPANLTAVDQDGSVLWQVAMQDSSWNAPIVADIDYDNQVEVIIGAMPGDKSIYVVNGATGNIEYTFSSCTCAGSAQPALCRGEVGIACSDKSRHKGGQIAVELDGNIANGMEIVADSCDEYIWAFHGKTGSLYWRYGATGSHFHSAPAAADIDGDGLVEVVANDRSTLYVFYYNGTLKYSTASKNDKSSPSLADLDNSGDGNLEIVVGGSDGYVRAFYNNLSSFWIYKTPEDDVETTPAIADIDDDCMLEVVVGTGKDCKTSCPSYAATHVIALNGEDGSLLWSESTEGGIISSPAIADIDGDEDQEVVVGSDSGHLYAFDVTGYGDAWPSFHQAEYYMDTHNIRRRGVWGGSVCGAPTGGYISSEIRSRVTTTLTLMVWEE